MMFAPSLFAADLPALDEAFNNLYNFDFVTAHRLIDREIAAHPNDPLPYAVRESAYLFSELDRLGILESEFLIDDKKIVEKKKPLEPDPATRTRFLKAVDDARRLGTEALAKDPNDKNALFALTIADGYHRVCASHDLDEDADIPCHIVDLGI